MYPYAVPICIQDGASAEWVRDHWDAIMGLSSDGTKPTLTGGGNGSGDGDAKWREMDSPFQPSKPLPYGRRPNKKKKDGAKGGKATL